MNCTTITAAMKFATSKLSAAGIQEPRLDSKILLCHAAKIDQLTILSNPERLLSSESIKIFDELIQRRALREPVSHLVGQREFWSLPFKVSQDVFDPRPESEILVQAAIDSIKNKEKVISALDIGTGSGCLIISLLRELPLASGVGVDISEPALCIARSNAEQNLVGDRIKFIKSSWGEDLSERFDIIITNPPYIPIREKHLLEPEVAHYEPGLALFGGCDGLSAYHHLCFHLLKLLKPEGIVIIECGKGQAQSVIKIFTDSSFIHLKTLLDLNAVERCCIFEKGQN